MSDDHEAAPTAGGWRTPPQLWRRLKPIARESRRQPTPSEDRLWQRLRNRRLADSKFRRQHSIERFIVDFYCAEAHLIVEVDGPIHARMLEGDRVRQEFLESQGFRVLRFTNAEVETQLDKVVDRIAEATSPPAPSPHAERGWPSGRG